MSGLQLLSLFFFFQLSKFPIDVKIIHIKMLVQDAHFHSSFPSKTTGFLYHHQILYYIKEHMRKHYTVNIGL